MAEKTNLPSSVFAVQVPNHELLKLAYDAYLANNRLASATTKQRGEVRGGGKKPWRQKGTGRARFGSIRNPIWRGGGIVFGPRGNENYTKKISKTSKRVALRQALTVKAENVLVSDIKTTGKTAEVAKFLEDNKLNRRVLIVAEKTDELIRATNNISEVLLVSPMYLNVFDLLNADHIVIAPKAIETIENWLGGDK
ncbi:50S ribosomal protein L4 [Candidatus Saccharibacteria bacterium]|jgi:large subunit ribosomal protein L4|nr:50S ribosomal protein L4 [Candidatus Saccharibacteria bacterium]MBP9489250.1 50S ribosomal protein L4 [Candidatus Saccharibacteria bacterium]MBP9551958.1 50S ribosomal protein L4 [Candidatus Saccharibacteria bacterium]